MLHGYRFKSCRWLYSVYTKKKLSHPSSLSYVLAVAPTMKRSAVQPKTIRLCSSIIVISLCVRLTVNHKSITNTEVCWEASDKRREARDETDVKREVEGEKGGQEMAECFTITVSFYLIKSGN